MTELPFEVFGLPQLTEMRETWREKDLAPHQARIMSYFENPDLVLNEYELKVLAEIFAEHWGANCV